MDTIRLISEALLITSALSLDALVSGFAYGANKVKIPLLSVAVINLICSAVLAASLFLGVFIGGYIAPSVTTVICVAILIILGLSKIAGSCVKGLIKKKQGIDKKVRFSLLNLNFILNIYASPEGADFNGDKVLSVTEAAALAFALSLDGLAVGVGAGLTQGGLTGNLLIIGFSFLTGMAFVMAGCAVGNKIAKKSSLNLSWLSGILLIGLALIKIFT